MQNLIERIKLYSSTSKNRTYPFFLMKSNKNKSSKCQSEITVSESDVKRCYKCLKKKLKSRGVLKKLLSPRKKDKSLIIQRNKWSEEVGKDSGTSGDSGWEGMSAASSLSSLVITGNFCTSSPVSEKKFKQFNFHQDDLHSEVLKFDDNDNDHDDNQVCGIEINTNKCEIKDKYTTIQLASGNFIRSKSDSEIFTELDCEDVAEKIRELTRDDPLRQSYPGMSNTTRRESCHQLLKILLTQFDINQHNEHDNTTNSKLIDETFETFDSDFAYFSDCIDVLPLSQKKSMRDTLLEISSRRLYPYDKSYKQNTSEYGDENIQSNVTQNILTVTKSMNTTADNFRDDIDKVMKRFESQKIVEDDEIGIPLEFHQPLDNSIISYSKLGNNSIYFG